MAGREPMALAGVTLDRVGAPRRDPEWVRVRLSDPASRAVVASSEGVFVLDVPCPRPALVAASALAGMAGVGEPLLLGLEGGRAVLAIDVDGADRGRVADALAPARLLGLRDAAGRLGPADGGLVAYASALLNWHRRHPRCSACGSPTRVGEGGLVRLCPACGGEHHPRTDPVVIVLVDDGDRALLGRQPAWPARRYSALAGFVEPGEGLEEAVAREVLEEAGVRVDEVRYMASQPWPFPSSLMLGFTARFRSGSPAPQDDELEDVRWFARAELRAAAAGGGALLLPPPFTIARRLIERWLEVG